MEYYWLDSTRLKRRRLDGVSLSEARLGNTQLSLHLLGDCCGGHSLLTLPTARARPEPEAIDLAQDKRRGREGRHSFRVH